MKIKALTVLASIFLVLNILMSLMFVNTIVVNQAYYYDYINLANFLSHYGTPIYAIVLIFGVISFIAIPFLGLFSWYTFSKTNASFLQFKLSKISLVFVVINFLGFVWTLLNSYII